jgi:hypothetical protein
MKLEVPDIKKSDCHWACPFLQYKYIYAIIILMKTLNIAISDVEYTKFGITNNVLSFSDFVDIVSKELMRKNIETSITQANTCGISSMTMDDITSEVQAVRRNVKNNN